MYFCPFDILSSSSLQGITQASLLLLLLRSSVQGDGVMVWRLFPRVPLCLPWAMDGYWAFCPSLTIFDMRGQMQGVYSFMVSGAVPGVC